MRLAVGLLALGMAWSSTPALAGMTFTEQTRTYPISGNTGVALLEAMDRKGPKHGLLTRAIAQTSYSIAWTIEWAETAKACRVRRADGKLAITYTYPKPEAGLSPAVARRWTTFIAGVRRHEDQHGALARQMAAAAERAIGNVSVRNDRGCVRARREVKRRMAGVYADYEARQIAFDKREHRDGGKVEGLILNLVRKR